jgi:hypothetical protein
MDIFMPIRFRTSVQLAPHEMHKEFVDVLYQKLTKNLEGVCSRFGYIRPGSIEILRRSAGNFVKQHFNGHIRFEMLCKAEVCNPPQDMVLKAVVRNKNTMGLLAESYVEVNNDSVPVLDIIIPKRAAGIASEIDLDSVEIGDEVYVSVQGKRFQLNDKKISIIGRAVKDPASNVANFADLEEDVSIIQEVAQQEGGISDLDDDSVFSDEEEDAEVTEEVNSDEEVEGVIKGANTKVIVHRDAVEEDEEDEEKEDEELDGGDEFFEGEDDLDEFGEDDIGGGYDDFE